MAEKLNVSKATISYDVHALQDNADQKLKELASKVLPFMYEKCLNGINEVLKEAWNIYESNDPRISQWHEQPALRLAKDCNEDMFDLFTNGPAMARVVDNGQRG